MSIDLDLRCVVESLIRSHYLKKHESAKNQEMPLRNHTFFTIAKRWMSAYIWLNSLIWELNQKGIGDL